MNFELDMHTHTLVSGHAYGTIREMAQGAAEKGLKLLGITEHSPSMPGSVGEVYYCNLRLVPKKLYGVEILFGSEINVLQDGTLDISDNVLNNQIDYGIVGIHSCCYKDAGREQNTDNLISCMKHPRIKFVSHPDDDHTPLNYERLVQAAKEYHVALEVNNSSFLKPEYRWNCVENYRNMLSLCRQYESPIIVDSDAHDPSWVGCFEEAQKLLTEIDFPEELVLNRSVAEVKKFIAKA